MPARSMLEDPAALGPVPVRTSGCPGVHAATIAKHSVFAFEFMRGDHGRKWGGRDEVVRATTRRAARRGWVSVRDKLHGRVVEHRRVVEMAPPIIVIRRLTDEHGAQPRLASKRVRVLPKLRIR